MQLDADDNSGHQGIALGQIGYHGQRASLVMVTITTRPTVLRQAPSGGSGPVAYGAGGFFVCYLEAIHAALLKWRTKTSGNGSSEVFFHFGLQGPVRDSLIMKQYRMSIVGLGAGQVLALQQ